MDGVGEGDDGVVEDEKVILLVPGEARREALHNGLQVGHHVRLRLLLRHPPPPHTPPHARKRA